MTRVMDIIKEYKEIFPDLQSERDELNPWLTEFLGKIYREPIQLGHADALFFISFVFGSGLNLNHDYETFSLMAYFFRNTLVEKKLEGDILTNLSHACVYQKSFEEAYRYGKLAQKYNEQDADLLANLIIASTATKRIQEAKQLSDQLEDINKMKLAVVNKVLLGEDLLHPTKNEDCQNALLDLEMAQELWNNNRHDLAAINIREAVIKLNECPDGVDSWKSWKMLGEFYISQSDRPMVIEEIEYDARAAAALGKMIAFYPLPKEIDPKYYLWYGQALVKLGVSELAKKPLEIAQSMPINDPGLLNAIKETMLYTQTERQGLQYREIPIARNRAGSIQINNKFEKVGSDKSTFMSNKQAFTIIGLFILVGLAMAYFFTSRTIGSLIIGGVMGYLVGTAITTFLILRK